MDFDNLMYDLELSLKKGHPSQRLDSNPVAVGLVEKRISAEQGLSILGQYTLLPARIVEILCAMAFVLRDWTVVHEELLDNVAQECGSRTKGVSHYSILRNCAHREFGINIGTVQPIEVTGSFLNGIVHAIHNRSKEFVAGMAYALEDSALPELEIVAEIINRVWTGLGRGGRLISRHETQERSYAVEILSVREPKLYSLEDFFVVHLLAIEHDHKNGLRSTIRNHVATDAAAEEVRAGFEFVLDTMDKWWNDLAESPAGAPQPSHA